MACGNLTDSQPYCPSGVSDPAPATFIGHAFGTAFIWLVVESPRMSGYTPPADLQPWMTGAPPWSNAEIEPTPAKVSLQAWMLALRSAPVSSCESRASTTR